MKQSKKMGELRGILATLESFLDLSETKSVILVRARLIQLEKEPESKAHAMGLLGDAATLSVELEGIVKKVTWNNKS